MKRTDQILEQVQGVFDPIRDYTEVLNKEDRKLYLYSLLAKLHTLADGGENPAAMQMNRIVSDMVSHHTRMQLIKEIGKVNDGNSN